MEYKHGMYGEILPSIEQGPEAEASWAYASVGTAPINLIRGYADLDLVNRPVKLNGMTDVRNYMGMSTDFGSFTLCENFAEHFDNALGATGPIYVVNVLNPATHRKATATTKQLTFSHGRTEFISDKIILDTLAIADKVEGTDYTVSYNWTKGSVVIKMLNASDESATVSASYNEVDPERVDASDIIGVDNAQAGITTGIYALRKINRLYNAVLTVLTAPKWSEDKTVYNAMCELVQNLAGHWKAFVLADIPISYTRTTSSIVNEETVQTTETVAVDTIAKAIEWKESNNYTNEYSKVFWPRKSASGTVMHLSTAAMATMMRTDVENDGVPFETPSNKAINADKQYFGANSTNEGFDDDIANLLNEQGITTMCYRTGRWVLWGPHTAAYTLAKYSTGDVDARAVFDVNIRMLEYITNLFQVDHGLQVDEPLTPQDVESITNFEQGKLDALKTAGALIGDPVVEFTAADNSVQDMKNGDFVWNFIVTNTPPMKSGTGRIAYTDAGFSSYFETGSEE